MPEDPSLSAADQQWPAMAFNLTRTAGVLASTFHAKATTGTIRAHLINIPGRRRSSTTGRGLTPTALLTDQRKDRKAPDQSATPPRPKTHTDRLGHYEPARSPLKDSRRWIRAKPAGCCG